MSEGEEKGGGMGVGIIVGVVIGFMLCGGVPAVGVVAAIAIPNFVMMQLKSKRAEVPASVDGIKIAELSYDAAYDGFLSAGSESEARRLVGKTPHDWPGGHDWDKLGWRPDGPVRGAYWVSTSGSGDFEVHGVCDVDGDGVLAEYVATMSTNATLVTPGDVY